MKLLSFLVIIADVGIRFFNTWDDDQWGIWKWRLDSYKKSFLAEETQLLVEREDKNYAISEMELLPVLQRESSGEYERRVYDVSPKELLWALVRPAKDEIILLYRTNKDFTHITLLVDNTNSIGTAAFSQLTWIMPAVFLKHNTLTFHGVLMEHEGKGIIISAASGTGKTTHARLWRDLKNALIINGDRAVCKKKDDVWTGYGTPWSGTSGEQINRSVPIKAFVVLERGEQNVAKRLTSMESFSSLLPNLLCPTWDKELVGTAMELLDDFLKNVPVYRLSCRPDEEAVEVLYQALQEV